MQPFTTTPSGRSRSKVSPAKVCTAIVDDFLAPVRGMFKPGDPKVTVTSMASKGAFVIGECVSRGTFADGRAYENLYVFALEFRDDQVYVLREYMDSFYVAKLQGLV